MRDLLSYLPVLAHDGAILRQLDAGEVLDYAMAGTTGTLLARKWESAMLVNVDNDTLRRLLDSPEAMAAVERIEGWRALGDNVIETIINKSEKVKALKNKAKDGDLSKAEKKELSDEEKEYKSKRKMVQEKLIKFATRIPAFMYLTDFRENARGPLGTRTATLHRAGIHQLRASWVYLISPRTAVVAPGRAPPSAASHAGARREPASQQVLRPLAPGKPRGPRR